MQFITLAPGMEEYIEQKRLERSMNEMIDVVASLTDEQLAACADRAADPLDAEFFRLVLQKRREQRGEKEP